MRSDHPHHDGFDGLDLEVLRRRPGVKWAAAHGGIGAWIADMDFPPCPAVLRRLTDLLAEGDLGYPGWYTGTPLRGAFVTRMAEQFGWEPDIASVREVGDLCQAVQLALHLYTRPGDAVALHVPAYPPFLESIGDCGRRLVPIPMVAKGDDWTVDPAALDAEVASAGVRMIILVNPQNPTGHVFTEAELADLADIARRRDLIVISDEIHAELTYSPHRHVPFASLGADAARRTVTITSASKAFNLAGLRCALMHIGSPDLLALRDAAPSELFGVPNLFGVYAALAAWSPDTVSWATIRQEHLTANRDRIIDWAEGVPGVDVITPQATYLAWIDVRHTAFARSVDHSPAGRAPAGAVPWGAAAAEAIAAAGVRVNPGTAFGPGGEGCVRLNFATSDEILDEALRRIGACLTG